jgi:hypothetical protein
MATDRNRTTLVWLLLGLFTALFFIIHAQFAQDDAYITYRYARNIVSGLGFVYNPGEWVLGTTTPLYTLLLALIASVVKVDVAYVSVGLCAVSLWISAGILFELGKPYHSMQAFLVALLFVVNPFQPQFLGMEAYFLNALILLALWAYQQDRRIVCALLCGLAVLTRYEAGFLIGIIGVADLIKCRKIPYWLLASAVPVLLWMIFALRAFGSPVPLSATVKLAAPRTPFLVGFAVYWYQFVTEIAPVFLVVVCFLIGAATLLVMRRLPPGYALVIVWGVAYLCIAAVYAGSFPWYYAPLVPAVTVVVVSGLACLANFPNTIDDLGDQTRLRITAGILRMSAVILIASQLLFWVKDTQLYGGQPFDNRYTAYKEVSDWLVEHAAADETVASFEIGYIGYFSNMRVVDLAGLVTPRLLPWVSAGAAETLRHTLTLYAPDYVIIPTRDAEQIAILGGDRRYSLERSINESFLLYRKHRV